MNHPRRNCKWVLLTLWETWRGSLLIGRPRRRKGSMRFLRGLKHVSKKFRTQKPLYYSAADALFIYYAKRANILYFVMRCRVYFNQSSVVVFGRVNICTLTTLCLFSTLLLIASVRLKRQETEIRKKNKFDKLWCGLSFL